MNRNTMLQNALCKILTVIFIAVAAVDVSAFTSPDGKISADVEAGSGIVIKYKADGCDTRLLTLVVETEEPADIFGPYTVDYSMVVGKQRHCENRYNSSDFRCAGGKVLSMRLYNDGVAWKYCGESMVRVYPRHWWLQKWVDSYEGYFEKDVVPATDSRWGYPALFEYGHGVFALLTESGIEPESAAASLHATGNRGEFLIRPDGAGEAGWQTLIAGSLGDVVESTLVTDNSAPSVLTDTSWIHPGVASWVYWAYNHGSNDYTIVKRYIDFAADLGLPYVMIDAEWDEMGNGKTVEDAIGYARSRGIRPMIWYNSSVGWIDGAPGPKFRLNDPEKREREFAWCESQGVSGVKIDFFSGDTNKNIAYMAELLECAARHKLLVNFHGATLPRGWQRTYPNLITTEAVYGAEWYNNVPTFTAKAASHNAMLPFTRNVVGSMDYTPCAFSDSQHPHITTHAHELALTVLFESGIQHIADRPESIMAQPDEVRKFLSALPAAWDNTWLLGGYPGEYVVLAREKDGWLYIAGINGTDATREIGIGQVNALTDGNTSHATVFADAETGNGQKWDISTVDRLPESLTVQPRGGFVIKIQKINRKRLTNK